MKAVSFRLTENDVELLKQIAEEQGCSRTEAVRFAIRNAVGCDTREDAASGMDAALGVLTEQLRVKDEQIAALNRALDAAHETAKAAQVLHAQERKALESVEQKSRWERLREAWRG